MNTLLLPPDHGEVLDLTGRGLKDIKDKLIDCPIDCDVSFAYDPKRILRALYFRAKYGFRFSDDLEKAMAKHAPALTSLSRRYSAEMVNKIIREEPALLDELIDKGMLRYLPMTKYLTKQLLEKKKMADALRPVESSQTPPNPIRKNLDYGEGWTKRLDEAREEDEDLVEDGKNIIDDLETAEYCERPRNEKYWEEAGDSEAAKDFQKYIREVKCRVLPVLQKEAVIRGPGVRECPFGLPISVACKNAGDSVDRMEALTSSNRDEWNKHRRTNRRVYVYHQAGERCVYADKVVHGKERVHCDYGDGGQRQSDFPMRPSPFYPRVFHGLGQYGLYSYPVNDYMDIHGARQLFTGIFSLYASTGEVLINKTSFLPDPILEGLFSTKQLIKDE
jgi:hypothetical protein